MFTQHGILIFQKNWKTKFNLYRTIASAFFCSWINLSSVLLYEIKLPMKLKEQLASKHSDITKVEIKSNVKFKIKITVIIIITIITIISIIDSILWLLLWQYYVTIHDQNVKACYSLGIMYFAFIRIKLWTTLLYSQ